MALCTGRTVRAGDAVPAKRRDRFTQSQGGGVMNMFAQTKTILTPTYWRERMAPPAPAKLDLRHGVILYLEDINVSFDGFGR